MVHHSHPDERVLAACRSPAIDAEAHSYVLLRVLPFIQQLVPLSHRAAAGAGRVGQRSRPQILEPQLPLKAELR
jgi:hypothetical protein